MPGSAAQFQDVYRTLLDDRTLHDQVAPSDFSKEDALLLLVALLSDLLYLRRSLGQVVHLAASIGKQPTQYNPFGAFSPHMELNHMSTILSRAMDKWHRWFHASTSPEIMAFYYYIRMHLSFNQILTLPQAAGYRGGDPAPGSGNRPSIPDKTVGEAWRVLDNAAGWSQRASADSLCPAWLPIAVFHAALVVWAHYARVEYGSARMLLAFKMELDGMTWPCCVEMAATLGRLIAASTSFQK